MSVNDNAESNSNKVEEDLEREPLTDEEKGKFLSVTGRTFANQEAGYVLDGHSGVFRLHMIGGRCDMVWTRSQKWITPSEGMTLGMQIVTESLFDLAMLSRELSDLVEQAIAIEVKRDQDKPTQWEPKLA